MERLTKRDTDGQAMMDCEKCKADWTGKHGKPTVDCTVLYCRNRLKARLAAYEDMGLTPQEVISMNGEWRAMMSVLNSIGGGYTRLRELAEADKDGRLVVLPCKVGDSIYIPDLEKKIPVKVRVQGISISVSGRTILHFGGYPVECAWGDGCGKDWFFTREEAEAALAQKGGTHEADSV